MKHSPDARMDPEANEMDPEFNKFSATYEELLKDPIRDRFSPGGTAFFHQRKRDLILEHFRRRSGTTKDMRYLDLGCGQGELTSLLREHFAHVAGCDPSAGMLEQGSLAAKGIECRVQDDPGRIPFTDESFDFVTAVCVYHHVPVNARPSLTAEVRRVLRPGGTFAIIEHNPWNPATRLIVSRTPVDADAILLPAPETRALMKDVGLRRAELSFFLYLPESAYRKMSWVESALERLPLGGQYAVFGYE